MNESPIFIVGCDRSGTTLLALLLNSHPNISIALESHYLRDVLLNRRKIGDLHNDKSLRNIYHLIVTQTRFLKGDKNNQILWDKLIKSDRNYASVLSVPMRILADQHKKKRWGDKTPKYVLLINELSEVFPYARFIHIIRDGRDVACSLKAVSWFPDDIIQIADFWKKRVCTGHEDGGKLGSNSYIEVHYENLVLKPEQELLRICEFLKEPYYEEMLCFYKQTPNIIPDKYRKWHLLSHKPVTASRINVWQNDLPPNELTMFELVAGKTLRKFGYQIFTTPTYREICQYVVRRIKLKYWNVLGLVTHFQKRLFSRFL